MCGCNHKEIDFELGRLHSLISEKDRQIELLKARCCNDDLTLDMNSKASVILGKMIGESLDEAAQRVIDDSITMKAELARAREEERERIIEAIWDKRPEIFQAIHYGLKENVRSALAPEQKGE